MKHQLLDHAEGLARTRGIDAFSFADLSDAVGIRKPSVHYHFPKKADLALAILDRYATRVLDRLNALPDAARAADKLRAFVQIYREASESGQKLCLCVAFSASPKSLDARILTRLAAFHDQVGAWLSGVFEDARRDGSFGPVGQSEDEAAALLSLVEGAQLMARAGEDIEKFDAAVRILLSRAVDAKH